MVAVGMLLSWLGYSFSLEGWCLWEDYNVTLGQLMSPFHPYHGPWPPAKIPAGQTWPGNAGGAGTAPAPASPAAAPSKAATAGNAASRAERILEILGNIPGLGFVK